MPKSARCPECHVVFAHPRNLLQHRREKHQGIRFFCSDCNHSYTRQYNLTHHRLKAHPDQMPPPEAQLLKQKLVYPALAAQFRSKLLQQTAPHKLQLTQQRKRRKPTFVRRVVHNNATVQSEEFAAATSVAHSSFPMAVDKHQPSVNRQSTVTNGTRKATSTSVLASNDLESRAFCCPLCPFQTTVAAQLQTHVKRHPLTTAAQGLAGQRCKFCSYHSSDTNALLQHGYTHFAWDQTKVANGPAAVLAPPPESTRLRCLFCDRKMSNSIELERHEQLHTNS